MIRCKTVSYYDDEKIDHAEFKKFRALLKKLYPTVFHKASYEEIGPSGILFTLKGKNAEQPAVFMAHYDVVPVNEEGWSKPPLGTLKRVLWERGTLATMHTARVRSGGHQCQGICSEIYVLRVRGDEELRQIPASSRNCARAVRAGIVVTRRAVWTELPVFRILRYRIAERVMRQFRHRRSGRSRLPPRAYGLADSRRRDPN
jgi:hypothetical protein